MPQQPTVPCFMWDERLHFIEMLPEPPAEWTVARLAILTRADEASLTFDAAGRLWRHQHERPAGGFPLLTRLLTYSLIQNPRQPLAVTWTLVGPYELSQLRDVFIDAVEHDPALFGQFVDPEELWRRVDAARSFGELIETWHWMEAGTRGEEPTR